MKKTKDKSVPLKWNVPDDIITRFAQYVLAMTMLKMLDIEISTKDGGCKIEYDEEVQYD